MAATRRDEPSSRDTMGKAAAADFELVIERVFAAPRPLVFAAWSEARHFARWFGPHGSTMPVCSLDARPGGLLHFCHRLPGREEVWVSGTFREMVAPEWLVFVFGFADSAGNRVERPGFALETVISVTFAEEGAGTRVTVRQRGLIADQGESQGWHEGLERLAGLLAAGVISTHSNEGAMTEVTATAATLSGDREILITRSFAAPRELVFEAWTNPRHLGNWWGPDGFTTTTHEIAVRPGGVWRFIMHGPDGRDYPNRIVFDEVAPPDRLAYSHSDDGDGDDVQFKVTVVFAEQGGHTHLTMRMVFPSAEERDRVVKEYGALEGATQHLARLEVYLADMR